MALTADDHLAIHELVSWHGHLFDNGELDRLGELFTSDIVYDASEFTGEPIPGIDEDMRIAAVAGGAVALGDRNPLGHHVTNIVVTEKTDSEAEVRSKGIGVMTDGRSVTVTYEDIVVRASDGWRIRHRKLIPRRKPLTR